MEEIKLFESRALERELLESYIKGLARADPPLRILEAGCGRRWPLDLHEVAYTLVGVDVDPCALEARMQIAKDLDEAVLGDLCSVELRSNDYDVIFCSFVLEHVKGARKVLDNCARWLKPNGLLILRIPERNSVYGFLARKTPLWVHVWYKKHVVGSRDAGKPGFGPYATYYERVVSRRGIQEYCRSHHFTIREEYGHAFYLRGRGFMRLAIIALVKLISAFSLGRLDWRLSNLTYVLEKEPSRAVQISRMPSSAELGMDANG